MQVPKYIIYPYYLQTCMVGCRQKHLSIRLSHFLAIINLTAVAVTSSLFARIDGR